MSKPTIGFIGLGLMGAAMVGRLQDKGYPVIALGNRNRSGIEMALSRGATEAATAAELARDSDIIMLCVGTSNQVESRMLGDDGVISGLRPGSVFIDFGTSLPASTRMLAEKVSQARGTMLDAPLGRTPAHAKDGLLNIMCAGDNGTFDQVKPVLDDLGENVFHLGDSGAGHTIKLINNFFSMTLANAMCEAFAMADRADISRQNLYDVMSAGPLHSGMMDLVSGYALEGDPAQLAFAIRNASKDVNYYGRMADSMGADNIMSASTRKALSDAVDDGRGDDMVSQMLDFYTARFAG